MHPLCHLLLYPCHRVQFAYEKENAQNSVVVLWNSTSIKRRHAVFFSTSAQFKFCDACFTGQLPSSFMETDDSADIPLSVVQNRIAAQPTDDEDDIPLATQVPTFSRFKRPDPQQPKDNCPPSDSDDDVPLASKLKKPPKSSSKAPPPRRRPSPLKREAGAKVKTKKVVKRAPRPKKEEDAPTRKFEKLGQRRETPPENDPTRLFYQSMYHEKIALGKKSEIAELWMLRHGLLDDREAENVLNRYDLKK